MKLGAFLTASLIGLCMASAGQPEHYKVRMMPKNGSKARGTVEVMEIADGVKFTYKLTNLPKDSTLGMHVHEMGDCTSKDGKSAGPHYMKMEETGGTSTDFPGKYAGDLPSITTDGKGKAEGSFVVPNLSLTNKDKNPIAKRALILHGGPDDVNSPSAPRIACGVIPEKATK